MPIPWIPWLAQVFTCFYGDFGAAEAQCSKYLSSFEARNLALCAWALAKMGSTEPWVAQTLWGKWNLLIEFQRTDTIIKYYQRQ